MHVHARISVMLCLAGPHGGTSSSSCTCCLPSAPQTVPPFLPCRVYVCVCTCISVCIDVYICMHLNIDPEEVHAVFEIFCDVPRTAEDKVEKYLILGLALAALVMSPGFLCGFNHCELFFPCSHLLNSCCRGDGVGRERNPPVNTGSLGAFPD